MLQKPVLADEALENKTTLTTVVKGSVAAHAFTPVGNMALVVSHSGHMCLLDPSSNRLAETSHPISGCTSAVWHPEVGPRRILSHPMLPRRGVVCFRSESDADPMMRRPRHNRDGFARGPFSW